jgi:hypothetical protein
MKIRPRHHSKTPKYRRFQVHVIPPLPVYGSIPKLPGLIVCLQSQYTFPECPKKVHGLMLSFLAVSPYSIRRLQVSTDEFPPTPCPFQVDSAVHSQFPHPQPTASQSSSYPSLFHHANLPSPTPILCTPQPSQC